MVKHVLFSLLILVPVLLPAQEDPVMIRVFTLQHVPAVEIVTLVRPLLSPQGSLTLQARTNSIAVKDSRETLSSIAQFLQAIDRPPRSFRVAIKMIQAGSAPREKGTVSEEIQGVGVMLSRTFPYTSYDVLAENVIEGLSGDMVSYRLNENFHVEFLLHNLIRLPNIVQLKGFRLFRVVKQGKDEILQPVLRTSINLKVNQDHVVGVSNSIHNSQALIFVLRATQQ